MKCVPIQFKTINKPNKHIVHSFDSNVIHFIWSIKLRSFQISVFVVVVVVFANIKNLKNDFNIWKIPVNLTLSIELIYSVMN